MSHSYFDAKNIIARLYLKFSLKLFWWTNVKFIYIGGNTLIIIN